MLYRSIRMLTAVLVSGLCLDAAVAQTGLPYPPAPAPNGHAYGRSASYPGMRQAQPAQPRRSTGYPNLNAPLYPCPIQNIPVQVGGTMFTNQAFAPHEMLHEHEYRALYPPFYYRVKGNWIWTPFGIESHDKWQLMGTEVKVKYSSEYPLLSGFRPPSLKSLFSR